MKVFLTSKLAGHRRGRYLATQLQAQEVGEGLPEAGVLLLTGTELQTSENAQRDALVAWCARPGRTLLVLPPYAEGRLLPSLDWMVGFRSGAPEPNGQRIPDLLAPETSYLLTGRDGDCDRAAGHQWPDFSVNTRLRKVHSGAGVFAATCLPLWSIALLNEAEAMGSWVRDLHRHTGAAAGQPSPDGVVEPAAPLSTEALELLVCLYGWRTGDPSRVLSALKAQPIPIFRLADARVAELLPGLEAGGLVAEQGLSEAGVAALRNSPFWGFAVRLREELL